MLRQAVEELPAITGPTPVEPKREFVKYQRAKINAVIDLLVERHVTADAGAISEWLVKHACTPDGYACRPDLYAPCPCGSTQRLKFCHRDDLELIFKRIANFPVGYKLKQLLENKEEGI